MVLVHTLRQSINFLYTVKLFIATFAAPYNFRYIRNKKFTQTLLTSTL